MKFQLINSPIFPAISIKLISIYFITELNVFNSLIQ